MKRKLTLASAILAALALSYVALSRLLTAQNSRSGDYLTPQLRQQVDQLKRDASSQPTNPQNVAQRGLILWQWINAYALTGGPVPVNATQELGPAFVLNDARRQNTAPAGPANVRALISNVDALIYEFRIKDENPKAIPTVGAPRTGPFPASTYQTFEEIITIGDMPMSPGGRIMLARMLQSDAGPPQNHDPAARNYVTLRCSNPRARFVPADVAWSGMHGGFRGEAQNSGFRLEGETLRSGDTITLTYGDRSGGSPGMLMNSFSNDRMLYPVYIDLESQGRFLTPAWPAFSIQGAQVTYVRPTAPSIVQTGERFELAVRSEDDRWNRATGSIPGYEISLNGATLRSIPAGSEGLVVLKDLHIDQPGVYRFGVRSLDRKFTAKSNPIWVEQNPAARVYWGETHAHSGFSEGMGSIDRFYSWARDDARLDFAGLSEHDIWLDDSEWRTMNDAVRRYTDPGRFVAFLAYEWTTNRTFGGHHNVFFRSPGRDRVPTQMAYNLSLLYQGLRSKYLTKDVLVIPHAHQAGDWRRSDPELERLVEIASMHGTFEWFGNYYLRQGYEVGFVGASDDHRTRPGYSGGMPNGSLQTMNSLVAVRARQKGSDEIFDALRDRATYAASDAQRILLDFQLNDQPAGQRIPYSDDRRIHARFSGTSPLDRVEVIKNGEVIFTRRLAQGELQPRSRVELGFQSSSEAFIRDNPRGYRRWRGALDIEGARLAAIQSYFDNRYSEFARQDPQNPNRIVFSDDTRGRADILMLDLDQVTPSTRFVIHLDQSVEHDVAPPMVRPYAAIPAVTVTLPFNEISQGLLTRELPVDRHVDSIFLQLVNPAAPMDGELDYVDRSNPQPGDYYYVRVTQLDGAHAWSSPIWVGGEPVR
ncbi:MAG TPA: DUF3604 domain-containing protein [Bryobacteraceae bacterium]|nr:DUF3604 domain-containing protein [Bryobacteraceae bacterium]